MTRRIRELAFDARQAVRTLTAMPWVSLVVVLSLGVAIGMNTVVFSWIQARVLRPLPGVPRGGSYYLVEPRTDGGLYPGLSWLEYEDVRARVPALDGMIAFRAMPLYVGPSAEVERVSGQFVSGNFFTSLGIQPAIGRVFSEEDAGRAAGTPVAVVSYGLWQSRLQGTPSLAGRTLRINGQEVSVIGVAPASFQGTTLGLYYDVWLPAAAAPVVVSGTRELTDRGARGYQAIARLDDEASAAVAQEQLTTVMRDLARAYPLSNGSVTGQVLPIRQSPRGPQRMVTALYLLQAVMLLLLAAVCGNVSNLLLTRASARQREVGIRLALGAAPWRIGSLLLIESVLLAACGAALGALLAVWGTKALLLVPMTGLPIRFQTHVDGLGLLVATALGVLAGLLSGLAPAIRLARVAPQRALRDGARDATRSRLRDGLLSLQAAFVVIVLIIAGLFVQSFLDTRDIDPGFRREGVLLAGYDLRGRIASSDRTVEFAASLLRELRAEPMVASAAIASSVPLDIHGLPLRMFTVDGRAREDGNSEQASTNTVTRGYFEAMGIPFRRGQDFADLLDPDTAPQAIVNEAFVARFLEDREPLGRRISARGRTFVVVGVVGNSLSNSFGEPPTPVLYLSYRDVPQPLGEIHVRVAGVAPAAFTSDLRRVVRKVDAELPIFNVRTLEAHVETNLVFRLVPARMFAVLGPLLLVLAAIGIYASVAYTAVLRTKEIGIRLALGASPPRLIARFVAGHLAVIGAGAAAGWLLSAAVIWRRATAVQAPAAVFAAVPLALLAVAALACWIPAFRASRAAPSAALRSAP